MTTVLIPSPDDLVQTAALRALGRRGDVCDVAWEQNNHPLSKYCRTRLAVPHAEKDPDGYVEAVIDLCKTGNYDVVLPTSMASLEALLPYALTLNEYSQTLFPSAVQLEIGLDKRRTVAMCREHGFAYPDTVFLTQDSNLQNIAESFGFPLIVKHQRNFGGSYGVRCVSELSSMEQSIDHLSSLGGDISDCMVQKYIQGALFDACAVARKGKVACLVTQERRLMYPISGGVAAHLVSIENLELEHQARNIISTLGWTGPIQLEFKWDADKKEFLLIEINPRFWGTTGAWMRAGINFPGVAVDLAMARKTQSYESLAGNLRFKYFIGRTPYAFIQLVRAKGWAASRDSNKYLKTWYDFDWKDPKPDLWRIVQEFRKLARGGRMWSDPSLPESDIPAFARLPV